MSGKTLKSDNTEVNKKIISYFYVSNCFKFSRHKQNSNV